MKLSLRIRFFLTSWPLVVAAVAAVALAFDRGARQEFAALEDVILSGESPHPLAALADTLSAHWGEIETGGAGALIRIADRAAAGNDLVLIPLDGGAILSTDSSVDIVEGSAPNAETTVFRQRLGAPGAPQVGERQLELSGVPVRSSSGVSVARLYVLPREIEPPTDVVRALRARFRRLLLVLGGIASLIAAVAAVLLASPLVERVKRLQRAASDVGAGALETRVSDQGTDELADLARSFNGMAAALERAEQQKRTLVADVAHELRTPLTNVVGLLEAIEDGLRSPDAATLASLREEVALLTGLVEELQDLTLAESGQLPFHLEPVDAVATVEAAIAALPPSHVQVRLEPVDPVAPRMVWADQRRLAQVLRNLLANALTHTPAGGTVRVALCGRADHLALRVSDSGAGIAPEHLPLVWERFYRVDPARGRGSGGSGIGLALVRQLVHGMRGSVRATSTPGMGSTFEVELPLPADPRENPENERSRGGVP
ncbi:MAG: ATP-binding protein [Gemmatimonadota bacterium]